MFLITGSGFRFGVLPVMSSVPMLIGPFSTCEFPLTSICDVVGHQSDPCQVWLLPVIVIAFVAAFVFKAASESIEVLPLEPCHAVDAVLQGFSAQTLPEMVIVP